MNQPQVYTCPPAGEPPSCLPHPTPSQCSTLSQSMEYRAPVSYSKFPQALYFTYGDVYVSALFCLSHPLLPLLYLSNGLLKKCIFCFRGH